MSAFERFVAVRDSLQRMRSDGVAACDGFEWPRFDQFNWATDYKSSDYRISPFELESVLIEHAAVAEAAVVPSPDPVRLAVPKAYVTLTAGFTADAATARSILAHVRDRVSPYKRIRRIEFATLPKTISGKIRRVELRAREAERVPGPARRSNEFWEADLTPSKT